MAYKQKKWSPFTQKPKDDDSDKMTDAEHKAHVDRVTEYNRKNREKNPPSSDRISNLEKKLSKASSDVQKQINKLNEQKEQFGSLTKNDQAKLKDLRREWSDHQTMLHNLRGK